MSESRKLGEHERLLHYLHFFGGMIACQVLHITGAVDPALLREGLKFLQRQHPMLRAHIRYGALVVRNVPPYVYRQPWLETKGTGEIDLQVIEGDWEKILTKQMKTPLPRGNNPRLRVVMVPEPAKDKTHLVIGADHAALDAYSCNMMARQLLDYLIDPAGMEANTKPTHTKLPPPLEEGMKSKPNSGKAYVPAIRLPRRPVPRVKAENRFVGRQLSAETMNALKAKARTKGATVHGALTAAFFLAMRDKYGVDAMTCLSSVDLRRISKPPLPNATFGCYIDILRTRHTIGEFWPTARDVSFQLITAIAKDQESTSFMKLPGFDVYRSEFLPTLTNHRRLDGLAVTTAGDSGLMSRYGNHTIEDMTMTVSLDMFGPYMVVITSERGGALDMSVNYATRAISRDDVIDVTDRAIAILESTEATRLDTAAAIH